MEFNFSPGRVVTLVLLLALFGALGGFSRPELEAGSFHEARAVGKAWLGCVALFVTGASGVSVVDHWAGNVDRTNLRFAYVIGGVVLMLAGWLWLLQVRASIAS